MSALGNLRLLLCVALGLTAAGCHHLHPDAEFPDVPREHHKITIGDYVINPPDVLVIDLVRAVPLPPYKVQPLDDLYINVAGAPEREPIKGVFRVEPEGTVRLPAYADNNYGTVKVVDKDIDEVIKIIEKHLEKKIKSAQVTVSLDKTQGVQFIRGEHLVRPDGTVNFGLYGRVAVAGMTQEMAKAAMEAHLSQFFLDPKISIDIGGFNSSVYYVIFDGGGFGEQVNRFPFTGNETVLDAISLVYGLPAVASKSRVWLARPEDGSDQDEVLPIDWRGITQRARTATNYQILPGDRIYVAAIPMIKVDTFLARTLAPVERIFGVVLLSTSAIRGINSINVPTGTGQ